MFSRSMDTMNKNLKFQQLLNKLWFMHLTRDSPFTVKFIVRRIEKEVSHGD